MIISFSVSNFRNIKDKVTLSFEAEKSKELEDYYVVEPIPGLRLLKLGLIYGPNGSGKSNFLRALNFLRDLIMRPVHTKSDELHFQPFLFDAQTPYEPTSFEIAIVANGVKYSYEVSITKTAVVSERLYYYRPNKAIVFERFTDDIKQLSQVEFGSKIKIKKAQKEFLEAGVLWNNTVLSAFLRSNIELSELKDITDWFDETLDMVITPRTDLFSFISSHLENKEIHNKVVIDLLKKADLKIEDIVIKDIDAKDADDYLARLKDIAQRDPLMGIDLTGIENANKIRMREIIFEHVVTDGDNKQRYQLAYRDESEGTKRYYQFSGLLDIIIHWQSVMPIDEIESSLHPDLIRHFLLVFLVNSKNSQIIATTHHRELLMDRDILRDDVIWFSEKKDDGSMDLYSAADFDSSVIRNTSSLFNAYKSGKLGAVPQLSDYYLNLDGAEN